MYRELLQKVTKGQIHDGHPYVSIHKVRKPRVRYQAFKYTIICYAILCY